MSHRHNRAGHVPRRRTVVYAGVATVTRDPSDVPARKRERVAREEAGTPYANCPECGRRIAITPVTGVFFTHPYSMRDRLIKCKQSGKQPEE